MSLGRDTMFPIVPVLSRRQSVHFRCPYNALGRVGTPAPRWTNAIHALLTLITKYGLNYYRTASFPTGRGTATLTLALAQYLLV